MERTEKLNNGTAKTRQTVGRNFIGTNFRCADGIAGDAVSERIKRKKINTTRNQEEQL